MVSGPQNHPFYWNLIKGRTVKDLLMSKSKRVPEHITICVAFLSEFGLSTLEEMVQIAHLPKERVDIYISREFSTQNCSQILERLAQISTLKIYNPDGNRMFHPKVFLFEYLGNAREVVLGSSNFTHGGLDGNVEFTMDKKLSEEEYDYLKLFIGAVNLKSQPVTNNIIQAYLEREDHIAQLDSIRTSISKSIREIFREDPFEEESYDLSRQCFDFPEYECFFPRNITLVDLPHRQVVQKKLMKLSDQVTRTLNKNINLHTHWNRSHVTSLARPCQYNDGRVEWMGVRFGKSKSEVDELIRSIEHEDEYIGFQKHACLQFSISANSFDVGLFHAVPHGAVDREYLHEQLDSPGFRMTLVKTLMDLRSEPCVWRIGEAEPFSFAKYHPNEFPDYYLSNDRPGRFSYLMYSYAPDHPKISNVKIADTINEKFNKLYPLYQIIAKRYIHAAR